MKYETNNNLFMMKKLLNVFSTQLLRIYEGSSNSLLYTVVGVAHTVVGVVVIVLGTLTNTSSAGTGSNPTINIQSSIVAVNFYRTLCVR
jgi:hypothetical protein